MATENRVTLACDGPVAQVRLARPDKLNALDPAMFDALVATGEDLRAADAVRSIVLAGEGRGFCAGMDTATFAAGGESGAAITDRAFGNTNIWQEVAMTWRKARAPVVAAIHGICFGGGLQIASGADIRIAHPETRFAIMEMKWGLVPDMGGFALWRGTVRDDVLRLLTYTAQEFDARQALEWGFVTELADNPVARATQLAETIAGRNPEAIRAAKSLANRTPDLDEDAILLAESEAQAAVMRQPNQIEAVMAAIQRRAPDFAD